MKDEKRSKFVKTVQAMYVLSREERRLLSRTAVRNRAYPEGRHCRRHCKLKVTKNMVIGWFKQVRSSSIAKLYLSSAHNDIITSFTK